MKNATSLHLHRLARFYGSYSQVARATGLDTRNLRRNRRGDMKPPTRRVLILAGKLLSLRLLVRELLRSGAVTPEQVRRAWDAANRAPEATEDRTC